MHKLIADISLRKNVEQSLHYARLGIPFCARCCGKTSRVFSSFGHNSTTVKLSSCLSGEVRLTCLPATRKADTRMLPNYVWHSKWAGLNPAASCFASVYGDMQLRRYLANNADLSHKASLSPDKRSTPLPQQDNQVNNEDEYTLPSSQIASGRATGETISLFSVDQIREQESPWKALTGISNADRLTRRGSPFKRRLQERKKICMLYGNLQKRALNRYLKEIHKPEELLLALESRLDVVLKRSALFPSIHSARQSILQGGICVNRTKVRSPRYHCTPGDLIEIIQKTSHLSKAFPQGNDQVKQRRQQNKDRLTGFDKWLDLFAFSELLQLGDRKIGRLYTSALSHMQEPVRIDFPSFRKHNSKTKRSNNRSQTSSLQNVSSHQPNNKTLFCIPAKEKENRKFQVDTSFTLLENNTDTLTGPKEKALDQRARVGTTFGSSHFQEDLPNQVWQNVTNHASVTQAFARESAELEKSRVIASRPLHLEVSYRNLCVIFLYPPQRICMDISVDLSLLV